MKITVIFFSFMMILLSSCGVTMTESSTSTTAITSSGTGETEPGARLIFKDDNFVDFNDFVTPLVGPTSLTTAHQCLGDLLKVYYVNGDDYMGTPTAMPTPSLYDDLLPTNRPKFIKNVSVDMTSTYDPTVVYGAISTDGCSYRVNTSSSLPSSCADFDRVPTSVPAPTIAPTATPVPTPTPVATPTPTPNEYFGSHYYRVRDDWCTSQGPITSNDPELTKENVGGVNVDLDRSQLGTSEDLLMVITYHAQNENSGALNWPAKQAIDRLNAATSGTDNTSSDRTILKVNLIGTAQSLEDLLRVPQPRAWTYNNLSNYPIYMKEIATLEDPFGSLRTEQVYIPLSQNALIDRIRIERVRGSFHLFQIDLYRLGNRAE